MTYLFTAIGAGMIRIGPPEEEEAFFAAQAEAIRLLAKRTAADIVEIGERLISVHERKEHGKWLAWLQTEFNWGQPTAFRYMEAAKAFSTKLFPLNNLQIDIGALYLLAKPDVPERARVEAIEAAETGEHVTKAIAEEMVAEARRVTREHH